MGQVFFLAKMGKKQYQCNICDSMHKKEEQMIEHLSKEHRLTMGENYQVYSGAGYMLKEGGGIAWQGPM